MVPAYPQGPMFAPPCVPRVPTRTTDDNDDDEHDDDNDDDDERKHKVAIESLLLSVYCVCASANVVTFGTPDVQLEICYKKRILKGLRNPLVFTFDNLYKCFYYRFIDDSCNELYK
uniref:Uncharacterized protein n=1 Tax=Anopheles merus TaxID=30066 RepID=A0A182V6A2_ANOME